MKNIGDILLSTSKSSEILMGNYALVKAMIDSGTKVVTSYPGSPTVETAEAIKSIPLERRPFYFEFSINEIVATEIALGASVNGNLSAVFFKSVGLNVAADCFVQLSLMNLIGGMVVVIGDDPGAHSSQNEQDNRHYAKMSYMPLFEPSSPSEIYSFYRSAARLSQKLHCPVILRLTTHVCHAKERVCFDGFSLSTDAPKTDFNSAKNGPYIPLKFSLPQLKMRAIENLEKVSEFSENSKLNKITDNGNCDRGIIIAGMPYLSLLEVLEHTDKKPDILKLGIVHPLPSKLILDFIKKHKEILILEELDKIIVKEVKCIAFDNSIDVKILGKNKSTDLLGEYTQDKIYEIIMRTWSDLLKPDSHPKTTVSTIHVGDRAPQMCPGCGHRSAFYAVKKSLKDTDITVADIGCHSLGFLPPYKMGEILTCMGASLGVGAGLSLFNKTRKVVSFLGDSTFFHAALPGIINAVFNKHNFTLILLENGTTAMTGHQSHPAEGKNFDEMTEKIPVRRVIEAFGITQIFEVDTYQQGKLKEAVIQAVNLDGFKVVIAKHVCMLKFMRENRKSSSEINQIEIDKSICQKAEDCISEFACPSFMREESGDIKVNKDLCIGDGSCIQTCPFKALKRSK